ncbi:site-specific integrase [Pandoraea commovens]|uniref:Site-specific integrase n=1 Tax=Pandoraea commovens TaxID=2508289 RepID=A0ABY5QB18_9BURK|nr:site-specific integrase [Pandoraea commovens]UVA77140.1 site-specific integrase [Pandoraea commovens]
MSTDRKNYDVSDVTYVESSGAMPVPADKQVSRAVRGRARTRAEWERREHLGIDHFAFFRGYLERLPLDKLADQYLETGLDLRMARSTLAWIQERLIAGARRAQNHGAARLLAITPKQLAPDGQAPAASVVAPSRPSLEEFAEEHDPDGFYSQRELLELFAEHYPESKPDRRAERNERLRKRQIVALRALQALLAVEPAQHHHCAGWFHPALARRLEHAGVVQLADLFDIITQRGPRWYTKVRGLGETGAKRLQQWLADHADSLGRTLPTIALTPRRQLTGEAKRAARVHVDGVAPLEWLIWPDFARDRQPVDANTMGESTPGSVVGSGTGREIARQGADVGAIVPTRQIRAGNDLDAVKVWLASTQAGRSADTVQSYRQHAERFLNWLAFVCRRPLAELSVEDCTAYREFLAAPPAHWIAPRGTARFTSAWRPFSKPLDEASVRLSMTVLQGMCSWLVRTEYLRVNPFGLLAKPRGQAFDSMHVEHVLTDAVWDALESYWRPMAIQDASAERTLFALQLGRTTGLRLAELARASVSDLRCTVLVDTGPLWSLTVVGKGSKRRDVELAGSLVRRIEAHLVGRGVGADLRQITTNPDLARVALIGRLPDEVQQDGKNRKGRETTIVSRHAPLTPAALRLVIQRGYRVAAQALATACPEAAAALAVATPHWLRHTFGTHALEHGAALEVVQKLMGHASIATTSKYLHPEKRRRAADMDRVFGA